MNDSYESYFRTRQFWIILITVMFVLSAGPCMIYNQPAMAVRASTNHDNNNEYRLSTIILLPPLIQQVQTIESRDSNISNNNNNVTHTFVDSFTSSVNDSRALSIAFQDEIAKWQSGVIDNKTKVAIINAYLPLYQEILNRTETIQVPPVQSYNDAIGNFSTSIESEISSNRHFANYLVSGNQTENELSLRLLSDALLYERKAFDAFESPRKNNESIPS